MSSADTILVVVDPRAKHQVGLVKGALLARKLHARVELFAFSSSASSNHSGWQDSAGDITRLPEEAFMLRALARPLREYGLEVTTEDTRGKSLSIAVAERAKHTSAKLVIKDVHRHATTRRASLTYDDWKLIRSCPVALLLSKPTLWPERLRICAAIDPEHDHAMKRAATLARQLGGEVIGSVHDVLKSVARELKAGIIVMGAASGCDLLSDVAGSTAGTLLEDVPCDVLVVKPTDAAASVH